MIGGLGFASLLQKPLRKIVKWLEWFGLGLYQVWFYLIFHISSWSQKLDFIIRWLSSISSSIEHFRSRLLQLKENADHVDIYDSSPLIQILQDKHDSITSKQDIQNIAIELQHRKLKLDKSARRDCGLCCIFFDVIMGIVVFVIINYTTSSENIAKCVIVWRDHTRDFLTELLEKLMGAPAGLKLNHEMTLFLGNFFKYHIYIWIGYLSIIEPYMPMIIQAITCSSFLGLSFMLSVTIDALNVLTFHTFCFYVYASKIYNLQLKGLISLSRLFRGVKCNPLRNRIDSISYNADQLAVGTILFTVLLFLLPTTGIYYFVFASLRIPILVMQAVMYTFMEALNTLPVHSITRKIFSPEKYIDTVTFKIQPCRSNSTQEKNSKGVKAPNIAIGNDTRLVFNYHLISTASLLKRHTVIGVPSFASIVVFLKGFSTGIIIRSFAS